MSMLSLALATTIAFPAAGQKLPTVEKAYMIGAVPIGSTNAIVVQGREVPVWRSGAWATLVDVVEGTNTVQVEALGVTSNHTFFVQRKPIAKAITSAAEAIVPAPPKVWTKLDYCSDTPRERPVGKTPSEITIVIDPGHGGTDTGALSPHGLFEKNANLLQANAVRKALEALGFNVLMTREHDETLVLTERPRLAVDRKADAFVSIHHNAPAVDKDAASIRYSAVYSWNEIGEELSDAISARLAAALDGDIPSKGSLYANFAVTRNTEIPSCLIEFDFLTSPEGEEAIFSIPRRKFLAEAVARGIADWCGIEE